VECVAEVKYKIRYQYIEKFDKNGTLIDSGTIGSNDGPLYALVITI